MLLDHGHHAVGAAGPWRRAHDAAVECHHGGPEEGHEGDAVAVGGERGHADEVLEEVRVGRHLREGEVGVGHAHRGGAADAAGDEGAVDGAHGAMSGGGTVEVHVVGEEVTRGARVDEALDEHLARGGGGRVEGEGRGWPLGASERDGLVSVVVVVDGRHGDHVMSESHVERGALFALLG